MPTPPPTGLLDAEPIKARAAETRAIAASCLGEVVNYGLTLLLDCASCAEGHDENIPIIVTYRHLMECVDGCRVLIDEACEGTCQLVLRSALEGLLGLEYLLEQDTERRGYAWLIVEMVRRRARCRRLHPDTDTGKRLREIERKDLGRSIAGNITADMIEKQLKRFEELAKLPRWSEAYTEWQRTKANKGGNPKWFSLYGGPGSLGELATMLNKQHYYEFLYRDWSNRVHAGEMLRVFKPEVDGMTIFGLRRGDHLAELGTFAAGFGLMGVMRMMKHYMTKEYEQGAFHSWYGEEVKQSYERLLAAMGDKGEETEP